MPQKKDAQKTRVTIFWVLLFVTLLLVWEDSASMIPSMYFCWFFSLVFCASFFCGIFLVFFAGGVAFFFDFGGVNLYSTVSSSKSDSSESFFSFKTRLLALALACRPQELPDEEDPEAEFSFSRFA